MAKLGSWSETGKGGQKVCILQDTGNIDQMETVISTTLSTQVGKWTQKTLSKAPAVDTSIDDAPVASAQW